MSHDLKIWQPLTPFTWLIFRLTTLCRSENEALSFYTSKPVDIGSHFQHH